MQQDIQTLKQTSSVEIALV